MSNTQDLKILRGAEPFFFRGGLVGCLCLHGLSASPQEVYWLGKHLAEYGATVYGPRLYGHGIAPEHLWRVRWRDWYLSALDGFHLLRQQCEQVFVLGMSMGGLLSLRLAAAEAVSGVVAMAAPLRLPVNMAAAHVLRFVRPVVGASDREADPLNQRIMQLQAQRGEPVTGRVAYYQHATTSVAELHRLQAEVARTLAKIAAPVLLIYSERDQTVPFANAQRVAKGLTASQHVTTVCLKLSDHIVTNDVEYLEVLEAARSFVDQNARLRARGYAGEEKADGSATATR